MRRRLLAANTAVVVTRLGDDLVAPTVATDAPTDVALVDDSVVREVVIITTADGGQSAVDPTTAEGQAAIADAIARGDDVETRTVSVPVSDRAGRDAGDGGVDGSQAGAPLPQSVVDGVLTGADGSAAHVAPTTTAGGQPAVPATVPGSPLDDALDAVDDVVDEVNGIVEDTRGTVNGVIEGVTDVVNDLTDGTTVSVPGVPVTVTIPPVTIAVPVVTTVVTLPPVTVPLVTTPSTVPCLVLC